MIWKIVLACILGCLVANGICFVALAFGYWLQYGRKGKRLPR